MISAGYIGGGQTVPAPAAPAPAPAGQVGFDTGGLTLPVGQGADFSDLSGQDVLTAWRGENSANRTMGYTQMGLGLVNQLVAWAVQSQWMTTQETIAERRALAAENISTDRRAVEERWLETQDKISKRTDGPGGLRERLARINANRDVEMYDRRMDTQERVAAMRGLDQAFSMRPEYNNYGTPYSPYA